MNLLHRGVYHIASRNLRVGVWDEAKQGFIGIREKFGSRYLFMEYHWDAGPPLGTAREIEFLFKISDDVPLSEYMKPRCGICESEGIEWIPDSPNSRTGRQMHINRAVEESHQAHRNVYLPMNQQLFDILDPYDKQISKNL